MNRTTRLAGALLLALALAPCRHGIAAEQFRIMPGDSDLRVLVFRSGSLAKLAHNHVISSNALSGIVVSGDTPAESTIDLRLPVQSLQVDDAAIRAEEGHAFSNAVSDKDIAGTRRNMMGRKLLQADQFNDIRVASRRVSGEFPDITIEAEITLRGRQYLVDLPAFVEMYEDRIVASGSADITHAQLGLTPFTAAFGAMRVGERMTFKYRIEAKKEDD